MHGHILTTTVAAGLLLALTAPYPLLRSAVLLPAIVDAAEIPRTWPWVAGALAASAGEGIASCTGLPADQPGIGHNPVRGHRLPPCSG